MQTFTLRIRPSVRAELAAAASAEAQGRFYTAFGHLERAHVLGQRSTTEHVRVHWHMLRFALRKRDPGEALGQAWRMAAAAVFTAFGVVPEGNTGGSDVSGLRRMAVPGDLRILMDQARGKPAGGRAESQRGMRRAIRAVAAVSTLAAFAALGMGCSTPPKDLDLSLAKPSAAGLYRVTLVPPEQAPGINQMHSWKVVLEMPDGTPVRGASFVVGGGMPQHGHGLPTQPRVTRVLGDGSYQIDGMKFSMPGWWEVKLDIQSAQGTDKVTFNTVVGAALNRS